MCYVIYQNVVIYCKIVMLYIVIMSPVIFFENHVLIIFIVSSFYTRSESFTLCWDEYDN